MKKANPYQTDIELKTRVEELKKFFNSSKEKYIDLGGYYIELRKNEESEGLRWFHRGKYRVEVVFDRESGPAQNVAGFVLFSNVDDAILHACLCEASGLRRLEQVKKEATV